jgi:hypothetical protein
MSKTIIIPNGKNKPFPKAGIVQQMNQPPSMDEFKAKLKNIMSENSISQLISQSSQPSQSSQNSMPRTTIPPQQKFAGNSLAGGNFAGGNYNSYGNFAGATTGTSNSCSDVDLIGRYSGCNDANFDNTGIRYSFSNFDTIINYIMGVLKLKSIFTPLGIYNPDNWNTSTITPPEVQTYVLGAVDYMFRTPDYKKFFFIRAANYNDNLFSNTLDYTNAATDLGWILNRLMVGANLDFTSAINAYNTYNIVTTVECRPATCLIGPAISCQELGTCQVSTDEVINNLSATIEKLLINNQELVTNGAYSSNVQVLLKDEELVSYDYLSTNFTDTSMNQFWFIDVLTDFYLSVYRQIICSNGVDRTKQERAAYYLKLPSNSLSSSNPATANISLLAGDRKILDKIRINSGALRRTNKEILTALRDRINVLDPSSRTNCGFPSINCVDNLDDYSSSLTSTYTSDSTTDSTSCTTRSCNGGSTCYPLYMTERQIRKFTNFFLSGVSRELSTFSFQDDSTMMIAKNLVSVFDKCLRTNTQPDLILKSILFQISQNNTLSPTDTNDFINTIRVWLDTYSIQGSSSGGLDWRTFGRGQALPAAQQPAGLLPAPTNNNQRQPAAVSQTLILEQQNSDGSAIFRDSSGKLIFIPSSGSPTSGSTQQTQQNTGNGQNGNGVNVQSF